MNSKSIKWCVFLLLLSLSLFSLCKVSVTKAGDNSWTSIGLYGAVVEAFVIDPNNNAVIWAATSAGLFKSEDSGSSWEPIDGGLSNQIEEVAVNPKNSNVVYAVAEQGVYKSSDAGVNWTHIYTSTGSYAIAVDPLNEDVVLFGGQMGGIWRSTDGGTSWQQAQGDLPTDMVREIVFAPSAAHIVYAAGFDGLWRSIDNGLTWAPAHDGFVAPPMLYSVAVDPYDAQVVYIGTGNDGIYKTTNGGDSWVPIGTGLGSTHIASIAIDPGNQQVIYVGGGINPGTGTPGVYRSLDSLGLSWAPMMDGMGSRAIYHLVIDNSTPQTIYAGTQGGMWKYTVVSGPDDYSISIDDGSLFTNQTAVMLTLTAPSGTTEMIISNDGGFGNTTWEPFAAQKPWTINAYGDYVVPRVVYAKFKTHGQTSGLYQDDIVLDVNAPTGSIEITDAFGSSSILGFPPSATIRASLTETLTNTVHLPLVMRNAYPGFTLVGLTLSTTDDVSGVGQMLVSNQASFADAHWEAYAREKNWWVPETGTTTVHVKFRDRAGNESEVYTDTFVP